MQGNIQAVQSKILSLIGELDEVFYVVRAGATACSSRLEYVSPAVGALVGYEPEDFLNDPHLFCQLLHPDDRSRVIRTMEQALAEGEPVLRRYRWVTPVGEAHWVEDRLVPLKDGRGRVTHLVGVVRDLTEQKRIEGTLQRATQRLAAYIEGANALIFILDPAGRITFANPAACQQLGYSFKELVGKSALELVLPEQRLLAERALSRVLSGESVDRAEITVLSKAGQPIVLEVRGRVFAREGQVIETFHIAHDITERVRAEEELRKLSNAVEQSADAVFITDHQGVLQYVNPAFERMTGYSREEALGQTLRIVKSGKYSESFYRKLWETILAGEVFRATLVNRRKDGELFYVDETITPLKDARGEVTHFVSNWKDVTLHIQQQERLVRLYQFGQELLKIDHIDDLCHRTIQQLKESFSYEDAGILLAENGALRVKAHTHKHFKQHKRIDHVVRDDERTPSCWVFQHRVPLRIDDVTQPPWEQENLGTRSWLLVPIQTPKEIFGVLALQHEQPAAFTVQDEQLLGTLAGQLAIAISNIHRWDELRRSAIEMAGALATIIERRDHYTGRHCKRLVEFSLKVGRQLGLPAERLEQLQYAALLHDIGKVAIPDRILHKPGKLTPQEWQFVYRHPEVGAQLVSMIERLHPAAQIIAQHQERYDGSGYPKGFREEEILLEARILAAVDAWDAMTSDRPYRQALDREAAIEELKKNAGKQFDPQVVSAFLKVLQGA